MIEPVTAGPSMIPTPTSRYRLKKTFQFIRQILKDASCSKVLSERKILLKLGETSLSDFIYQMVPRVFERGSEFRRLKSQLKRAAWNEEAAYQAEVLMNELDEYYKLASIGCFRRKKLEDN